MSTVKEWTPPIVSFTRDFMLKSIGFGLPIMQGSMFKGFNRAAAPGRLDAEIWFDMVPGDHKNIAYAAGILAYDSLANVDLKTLKIEVFVDEVLENLHSYFTDPLSALSERGKRMYERVAFESMKNVQVIRPTPPTP